jgi:hypothetical protein
MTLAYTGRFEYNLAVAKISRKPRPRTQAQGPRNRHLSFCQSARAQAHAVGPNEGRDGKLQVGEARGGRPNRVCKWTPDAHLRHSTFVGLRDHKDAREVVREVEATRCRTENTGDLKLYLYGLHCL